MSDFKKLTGVHGSGSTHWVGDGFPVRNLFPSNGLNGEVSPFLMLDYAGPRMFEPAARPRGVGEHPHRGFETVTIAYQGSVAHRDSAGNSGVIGPGDVQWMTAASGVVHEEMHEAEFTKKGGIFEMVQLWVNLPAKEKMSKPRYQGIESAQIPVVELGEGSVARIIAGSWAEAQGAAQTVTPVELFDLRLKAGAKVEIPVPEGHNAAVVLLRGGVTFNGEKTVKGEAQIATFTTRGGQIAVEALEDTTLLVLGGEPINEPVASYGPFVMNTREQIMQAIEDFNAGRMGRLS
ncbi:pirin family protein [Paludibaculum fermentans]|uniref:Pirin family protein n=1 Tax=Paludibaculum fermentans TaxID=1473598 RepID=A0A7S7NP35_PALFE|nr:pirin family protein [Paludibaculum fermentans]QOY87192.1 pirin family protein [Paludibaculum fermentans]